MINLGKVKPGSTIYVPFETFGNTSPEPITITGLATSDIKVYKNGSTTERASASGFTLLDTDGIDFDALTGIHGVSIDLADNTTADFWTAGAKYFVVIGDITVDSLTMRFIPVMFEIGYSGSILDTTIATLASQTSFTLTAGPAEDDALNGCDVVIHDIASAVQIGLAAVIDYTGSTKTVTLAVATTFTVAAGDNISIMPRTNLFSVNGTLATPTGTVNANLAEVLGTALTEGAAGRLAAALVKFLNVASPTGTVNSLPDAVPDAAGGLPVSDAGGLDLDAKLANTNEVTAARMATLTDWIDGGRLDLILDARANQSSVDDLPTNSELATALGTADDATLAAVAGVLAEVVKIHRAAAAVTAGGAVTRSIVGGQSISETIDGNSP